MCKKEFKGSGLDKITGKTHSGSPVVHWYDEKNMMKLYIILKMKLPNL